MVSAIMADNTITTMTIQTTPILPILLKDDPKILRISNKCFSSNKI